MLPPSRKLLGGGDLENYWGGGEGRVCPLPPLPLVPTPVGMVRYCRNYLTLLWATLFLIKILKKKKKK